jgi:hypothetical protein
LASSALDGRLILWSQDAKLASVAPESKKDPAAPKDTNPFKDLYAAKRMTLTTEHIVITFEIFLCYIFLNTVSRKNDKKNILRISLASE